MGSAEPDKNTLNTTVDPGAGAPSAWRWLGLLLLFLVEAWLTTYQLRFGRLEGQPDWPWVRLAAQVPAFVQILLVTVASAAVFGWRILRDALEGQLNRRSSSWL